VIQPDNPEHLPEGDTPTAIRLESLEQPDEVTVELLDAI
jgi:hypothetical protein